MNSLDKFKDANKAMASMTELQFVMATGSKQTVSIWVPMDATKGEVYQALIDHGVRNPRVLRRGRVIIKPNMDNFDDEFDVLDAQINGPYQIIESFDTETSDQKLERYTIQLREIDEVMEQLRRTRELLLRERRQLSRQ